MSAARRLARKRRREYARMDRWAAYLIGTGIALAAAMAVFWPT